LQITTLGATLNLSDLKEKDTVKVLFSENCGIVIQASHDHTLENTLLENNIDFVKIGTVSNKEELTLTNYNDQVCFDIVQMRDSWYKTSHLLDIKQSGNMAVPRFENYKNQPLEFTFPKNFNGKKPVIDSSKKRIKAAIIREKGSNSEREMANAMY